MTSAEYVNAVVGTPWVLAGNDWGAFDCWGLVEHSYRALDGVSLPPVEPRDDVQGAFSNVGWVQECDECEGAIFGVVDAEGNMHHVGRVLAGMHVHAHGSRNKTGQTRASTKRELLRFFRDNEIKYYKVTL
ncbi:minor tail protein [Idiomarinaceae phage Phi1M2-2]|uniref:minor tail protein n=1 Tax=Idiomarinaceae phage Phi1M2-2 TaxID=1527515 RepID=UPI0004F78084|nr:minor tail protein [Idiomarinaceae phage Phi1M2-2]AIM40787.1 putative NlpC/P60 hydrolase family protein [Idiomarinaceae phage Phi1M2-2]